MLFDSHCHLQLIKPNRREEVLREMTVRKIGAVCVGTAAENWEEGIKLVKQFPENLYLALGWHCEEVKEEKGIKLKLSLLEEKLKELGPTGVKAVGEIGLDWFLAKTPEEKKRQQELFLRQLEVAQQFKLPVIIHCREAYQEVYHFLKQTGKKDFVMHFFVGTLREAEQFLSLGGYLSFSSVITLTDDYNQLVKEVPLSRILVETDSPFLRNNSPLEIDQVVEKVARLKEISYDEVVKSSYENAVQFFHLIKN